MNIGDKAPINGDDTKRAAIFSVAALFIVLLISNFSDDSLESLGIVQSQVGENLAVDLDTSLCQLAHEY